MKVLLHRALRFIIAFAFINVFFSQCIQDSQKKKINSQVLQEKRTVLVHLPSGYKDTDRKYPVLLLLDGGDIKTFSGDKTLYSRAEEFLVSRSSFGEGIILVGVANKNRSRDMIPVKSAYHIQSGGAESFLSFITTELIPWISDNYRTTEQFIIYGQSDAGLFALYTLLKEPEPFYGFICVSPTIGVCKDYIYSLAKDFNLKENVAKKHLFLVWGSNDYPLVINYLPDFLRTFGQMLTENFLFKSMEIPDAGHNPNEALGLGLQQIYSKEKD